MVKTENTISPRRSFRSSHSHTTSVGKTSSRTTQGCNPPTQTDGVKLAGNACLAVSRRRGRRRREPCGGGQHPDRRQERSRETRKQQKPVPPAPSPRQARHGEGRRANGHGNMGRSEKATTKQEKRYNTKGGIRGESVCRVHVWWTRSEPAGPVCGRADEERQEGRHTVKRWLPFPEMSLGTSVLKHTRSALRWCAFDRDDLQVSCSLHNSNATTSSANESGSACLLAPLLLRSLLLRAGCPRNRAAPGGAGTPPSTASRRKPNRKPQAANATN